MKIIKAKSRAYKNKVYYKYRVCIPEKALLKAGFKHEDDLNIKVKKGQIILKK